jgi:hypothetical protein
MTATASRVITVARDFRAAGGAELFWRVSRRVATAVGRIRARFPAGALNDDAIRTSLRPGSPGASAAAWAAHLSSSGRPFFFSPSDRPRYQSILEGIPADDRAEPLRRGSMLLYGRTADVGLPVDWHADPLTGTRWLLAHWSEVPLVVAPLADVRHVWELSRHADLFVLGRAYWRTGDRSYVDSAATRLVSWLDANPPEMGINWWSNLEVSMRAQAFVWALYFFADAFEPALLWRLTGAIISSARHIAADLPFTRRTMPGNHVIGDAAGLATIALALPELREAAAWRDRTIALLEAEALVQVHADGTHAELSPAYHAFVWELLFGVMTLAARSGIDMPNTREALGRMARVLVRVSTPDGEVPPLGDSDEAVGWDLGDGRRRVGAIAALASSALGVSELAAVADPRPEEHLWLLGSSIPSPGSVGVASRQLGVDAAANGLPLTAVTDFGVCARSSWDADADWCLLRHGGLSRHTHADALNLLIMVGGMPCLIDAGTSSYNATSEWRQFFRGTSAHNTVVVDGLDQAEPHRTFRWSTDLRARARVVSESDDAVFVAGEHDGYGRVGVQHTRQVLWLRAFGWIVVDRLSGTGSHAVQLRWLMPDDAVPTPFGARLTRQDGSAELAIARPWAVTAHRAALTPPAGWRAQHYGTRESALAVLTAGVASLPCTFVSLLAPLQSSREAVELTMLEEADDGVSIRASAGDRSIAVSVAARHWSRLSA